jgi:hypothetical protein
MSIDAIDAAFIERCGRGGPAFRGRPAVVRVAEPRENEVPVAWTPAAAPISAPHSGCDESRAAAPTGDTATESIVDRLLATARPQWNRLAETIEEARGRGRRVIAVAGGEPGEGRSTLVAGLARVLRGRGQDVVATGAEGIGAATHATHDRRIVLVDAGIWFPPGPVRRQRLAVASLGCEAAILVRRADRQPAPAREAALAALGIEVLGEVVSFASPDRQKGSS